MHENLQQDVIFDGIFVVGGANAQSPVDDLVPHFLTKLDDDEVGGG